jgi:hypothetical protein
MIYREIELGPEPSGHLGKDDAAVLAAD